MSHDPEALARDKAALERRLARLQTLTRLSELISSHLDLGLVLREIARAAARLMDAPVVGVWETDEDTRTLHVRAFSDDRLGAAYPVRQLDYDTSLPGWVAIHRRAVDVPDVLADGRILARDWFLAHGLRSAYAVPILHHETLLGVLALNGRTPFRLGVEDLELLDSFVAQAALAIRNARLYRSSELGRTRLSALVEATRNITRGLDLPAVLQGIAEAAAAIFEGEAAFRLVEGDDLVLVASTPGAKLAVATERLPIDRSLAGVVARTGEPEAVADLAGEARLTVALPAAALAHAGAVLCLPVRAGPRVLGTLLVFRERGHRFEPEAVQLGMSLADQAGIAVENARLYEETEARRREAEALARVISAVTRSLDVERTLEVIVAQVCGLLGIERAGFALVESPDDLSTVRFVVPRGMSPAFTRNMHPRHARDGTTPAAIAERRVVWTADLLTDPAFDLAPETREAVRAEGYRAVLSAPMLIGGRVLGVLTAYRDTPGPFRPSEVSLIETFARHAAVALENARLYAAAERRRHEAERIAQLARDINGALDVRAILQRLAETARELCDADIARIALRDPEGDDLVFEFWAGPGAERDDHLRMERGKGIGGYLIATGRPFRTADYLAESRITHDYDAPTAAHGIVAALAVPILAAGRVEGAICVNNRTSRPFTDHHEDVMLRLADQAAVAIRNATLYGEARAARDFLRSIAEHSPDAIVTTDRRGRVTYWSPRAEETLGYRAGDVLGRPVSELHREGRAGVRAIARRLRKEGRLRDHELEIRARDGRWIECRASLATLRDAAGRVIGTLAILQDASERRRLEAQLRQAQKMEAVGRLAGGVAHDFNNLLAVIMGHSELILATLSPNDPLGGDVEEIRRASERAATLTRQLLAFSRRQLLRPQVVDPNALVGNMASMLRRLIGEDVTLDLQLDPGTGQVAADPGALEQVIMNLAVNARDAMPHGGRLTLETTAVTLDPAFVARHPGSAAGRHVRLSARDTGCGMAPDVLAHVFEPFFTTKEPGRGTGLGLSTVYGIVKQHHGYIDVESEPARGSVFHVYLPRVDARPDAPAEGREREQPGGRETVLLVEDEAALRELAQTILTQRGYTVVGACDGVEALAAVARWPGALDLVVTDVIMPRMSGAELVARLRADRPGLRVLYISGYTADALRKQGELGRAALLLKPFPPSTLLRRVREVLDGPAA